MISDAVGVKLGTDAHESPGAPRAAVLDALSQRERVHAAEVQREQAISGRLSMLRLAALLPALAALGYALFGTAAAIGWSIFAVFAVAFAALVVRHAVVVTRLARAESRLSFVQAALSRARETAPPGEVPAAHEPAPPPNHPYAGDLDVFGSRSLFRLLSTARTPAGAARLAAWLVEPASPEVIRKRQQAARELGPRLELREDLAVEAEFVSDPARETKLTATGGDAGISAMVAWAEAPPVFDSTTSEGRRRLTLARVAFALVAATLGLIAAWQLGALDGLGWVRHAWALSLVLQLGVYSRLRDVVAPIVEPPSGDASFGRYGAALARIELESGRLESQRLAELDATLRASGRPASDEMRSLETRLSFASFRETGIIFIIIGNLLLWDLAAGLALDAWRKRVGVHVRGYLDVFAEIEALSSLGAFCYEHPDYAFPEIVPGEPRFEAEALGHPLIPTDRRVTNDLTLGGDVRALVITGSNMSGKSTLLRSMGAAAVMAQAGAPVCARRLVMSPARVMTSMRISDSLREGVSHFYAELERLKAVVDQVNAGAPVLFALDEVLHGTNSRERHIGAEAIALHIVSRGAIGALTSHDIALAGLEAKSGGGICNAHFEELVEAGRMSFDYKLKSGPVTTSNALRLMKLVGIDVPLPDLEGASAGRASGVIARGG